MFHRAMSFFRIEKNLSEFQHCLNLSICYLQSIDYHQVKFIPYNYLLLCIRYNNNNNKISFICDYKIILIGIIYIYINRINV